MKKRLERPSSEPPCFEEEPRSPQKTGTTASLDRDNEGLRKKSGMWTVCSGWEGREKRREPRVQCGFPVLYTIQTGFFSVAPAFNDRGTLLIHP